ncbi:PREDICTED: alpha-ketoglutarate-dependent dioxygenase alkB homolog 6 [Nicrophorus vespilloides]|uniref:Alpha-ketoglutarate-dependent dioxygenase alkB homolog 6 n=1 Tax=Nicrophorus vespilloides TaxID=110193 RepID=A0ABM1MDE5_NICVS|nr:PREDICTED: alpha-ketoglutarate-dependent dioxygenase alkB homolog 6 [Nicrophorus vespilloides]
MVLKLEEFKVEDAPKSVYYIPNFISTEDEEIITSKVYGAPKPKWTCLKNRRLQDYGGIPHRNGIIPEQIPLWLVTYMDRVSDLNVFQPSRANHCLVNEYLPGQGIMPHLDGPIFFPTVTTITCGSHTMLEFLREEEGERYFICKLLLEPRSLVILKDDMYKKYLHTIEERIVDTVDESCVNLNATGHKLGDILERGTRVSLTIRNVPKVLRLSLFNIKIK